MITYPNYDRSILSIAASVLKHFGVKDCQHKTLPEFDELLSKGYNFKIIIDYFNSKLYSASVRHSPVEKSLPRMRTSLSVTSTKNPQPEEKSAGTFIE